MSHLPTVLNRILDAEATFTLALAPELLGFQGHFPGNPILPGVVQLDWAVHFATEAFGPLGTFRGMEHVKFMQITRPGEQVDLHLAFNPEAGRLTFSYASPEGRKSSGILHFSRP